ncbi:MFS transporter [Halolactibacillus miurensis]|uniref:Major Facilitator Superfamily protein n=2 Tax=Halolactibacillus TaxID=306539 RepID=A0A1I6V1D6_9BACI|nr:Major Facilitator Superfamily protein [Halolactibacillus miurensis]
MTASSLLLFGACSGVMNVIQMSLIQIMTPTHLMGRVMATLSTVNNIATPIGSLIGGLLLLSFDVQSIIMTSAIIFIIISGYLLSQSHFTRFDTDDAKQFKASFES